MAIEIKINEVRLARKGETVRQKEIWKRCFGDPDSYIDFYYANRYKEDETAVLLHEGEISAMLTRIPVKTVLPDSRSFATVMLYAIATHPNDQNKGFATQLMDFSHQFLGSGTKELSVLVPAKKQLFDFYRKLGYQDGFQLRETLLIRDEVDRLPTLKLSNCTMTPLTPEEYNCRRNKLLTGRLYISYTDEDIAYQKKLSQLSGADIYAINIEDAKGCLAVERMTPDKVLIKELLLPEDYINDAIQQIVQQLPAENYILRTPSYSGEHLGGSIRPFGMIRFDRDLEWGITPEALGYLGFAFD